jgi:putative methyltransferase
VGFISITDANFGMFPERDNMIADKIIEVQEQYGYPKTFSVAWAKNQRREVVDIVKKLLNAPGFNQGLTLSVQSLDVDVLENIRRRNMEMNKLEEVFELCEQRNIPTYTELILGLPGESLASWKENFWRLFRMGNHTGLTVFQAQLLENAEMNLLQKKMYRITSQRVTDYFSGSYSNEHIEEGIDIVTGTRDMPYDVMLDAEIFSWYINTMHINGVSTMASRVIYKYLHVDYSDFYEDFFQFLQQDPWWIREQAEVRQYFANWMTQGRLDHPNVGGIEIHGWNLIHRTILNLHVERKYDHLFDLLNQFMLRYHLPDDLHAATMRFQRRYLVRYDQIATYPEDLGLEYNLWEYLAYDQALVNQPVTYRLDFPEDKCMSFPRFLELFYFARRRNFGKTTVERLDNATFSIDMVRRGTTHTATVPANHTQ